MHPCKNCGDETEDHLIYCSLTCRNIFVNHNLRDYDKIKKTFKDKKDKKLEKELQEYDKNPKFCLNCNKLLPFEKRKCKCCNRSCACSFSNNNRIYKPETGIKISNSIKNKILNGESCGFIKSGSKIQTEFIKICEYDYCKKEYITFNLIQKFCCKDCARKNRYKNKTIDKTYKILTQFNFSLNTYPEEFNFKLIEEYGWYKAKNHGNNLNGISRDHILSVNEGFKNNINPLILAHPANCQLLPHNKNVSKGIKCGITLDNLLLKIEKWDKKYGKYFIQTLKIYVNEEDIKYNKLYEQ